MATQTKENKITEVRFEGFDGIDGYAAHSGGASVSDMVNFRILEDGSVEKRCGYRKIGEFPEAPAAFWCGRVFDNLYLYAWLKNYTYRYDFSAGTVSRVGAPIGDHDLSKPKFLFFGGNLYLSIIDGIYHIAHNGFMSDMSGYAPLVGKDWTNDLVGEINEPLNILNRRARFTYTVSDTPSIFFRVLYPVKTIDSVKVNGIELDSSMYYFDSLYNSVNISKLEARDKVEIAVTYDLADSSQLASLFASDHIEVFGGMSNSRIFAWSDAAGSMVYSTGYISPSQDAANGQVYTTPSKKSLYFPEGYEFKVGNGDSVIKAIARHYDRLLFFTEKGVWMADNETCALEPIPAMNINSSRGCSVTGGVAIAGNDPISVGQNRILRWTSDTDELNECNAYCISEPISHLLPEGFFANAKVTALNSRPEVWFYDPTDTEGTVWIYQWEKKVWYRFGGILADHIFEAEGQICFIRDKYLYRFDESAIYDYDDTTEISYIKARLESGYIELGSERSRRLKGISIRGEQLDRTELTLSPDGLAESVYSFSESTGEHKLLQKRMSSGRFRQMKLKIESNYKERTRIHGISLSVK